MKILIVHNSYLQPGGEDEVVKSEITMLQQYGHHVTSYIRSNDELLKLNPLQKLQFFSHDIYWSKRTYNEIREILRRENVDLAHIHNTFSRISPSVYQAFSDHHIPIVQTLHNYRYLCPIGVFYRHGRVCEDCLTEGYSAAVKNKCWKNSSLLSWFLTQTIKKSKDDIYNKVDRFIVLSEFSRQMYSRYGLPAEKISVKPNFLHKDVGESFPKKNQALFVGALHAYKGVELLLNAAQALGKEYPIKVIGDGPLRFQIEEGVQKGYIAEFLGRKSWEDMIKEMKQSLFLIVPSTCYETFGRVIIEAFACGIPVVASNAGALRELIDPNKNGIVFDPTRVEDLVEKIREMFHNRARLSEMGSYGRRQYQERFTAAKNYEQLMTIYKQAISNHAAHN